MKTKNNIIKFSLAALFSAAIVLGACDDALDFFDKYNGDESDDGTLPITAVIPVESVAFSFGETLILNVDEKYNIAEQVVFTPEDASNKDLIWWCEADPGAAFTFDEATGEITTGNKAAVGEGLNVGFMINTIDGNKQASCTVNIKFMQIAAESITLSADSLNLDVGDEAVLTATVFPATANNYTLSWESSDTNAATVDENGLVSAKFVSTDTQATITVKAINAESMENEGGEENEETTPSAGIVLTVAELDPLNIQVANAKKLANIFSAIAADNTATTEYTVNITDDIILDQDSEMINTDNSNFANRKITITDSSDTSPVVSNIRSAGGGGRGRTIRLKEIPMGMTGNPVITVGGASNAATVILTGNLTLEGTGTLDNPNPNPLVKVNKKGIFELAGNAKITGNISTGGSGCGVYVSGTFNMTGGEISGNTSKGAGAGVYVSNAAVFNMSNGVIAGNKIIGNSGGGGVYLNGSKPVIIKSGGIIYGNENDLNENLKNTLDTNPNNGAAVIHWISSGTKVRNTTLTVNDNTENLAGMSSFWEDTN